MQPALWKHCADSLMTAAFRKTIHWHFLLYLNNEIVFITMQESAKYPTSKHIITTNIQTNVCYPWLTVSFTLLADGYKLQPAWSAVALCDLTVLENESSVIPCWKLCHGENNQPAAIFKIAKTGLQKVWISNKYTHNLNKWTIKLNKSLIKLPLGA